MCKTDVRALVLLDEDTEEEEEEVVEVSEVNLLTLTSDSSGQQVGLWSLSQTLQITTSCIVSDDLQIRTTM